METYDKIGKLIELNISNGFYFRGRCIDENDEKIIIIDKNNQRVEIKKDIITFSRELSK